TDRPWANGHVVNFADRNEDPDDDDGCLHAKTFEEAKGLYTESTDKLRMDLQVALIDREAKRTEAAIRTLRDAQLRYSMLEESKAAAAWLNILDPPPPPPAQPKQK
ncbi:MAG: hypothetical protein ACPG4K_12690, partial [Haloferula sp.]